MANDFQAYWQVIQIRVISKGDVTSRLRCFSHLTANHPEPHPVLWPYVSSWQKTIHNWNKIWDKRLGLDSGEVIKIWHSLVSLLVLLVAYRHCAGCRRRLYYSLIGKFTFCSSTRGREKSQLEIYWNLKKKKKTIKKVYCQNTILGHSVMTLLFSSLLYTNPTMAVSSNFGWTCK